MTVTRALGQKQSLPLKYLSVERNRTEHEEFLFPNSVPQGLQVCL